jgi:hypothetical protein
MTICRDENAPYIQPYDWCSRQSSILERLDAAGRPATKREMAEQLALLLKAFPNASSADGEIFGALLLDDVASREPTIGDLEEACRWLRRTLRFLPTIAEVLDALHHATEARLMWVRSTPKPKSAIEPPKPQIDYQQAINIDVVLDNDKAAPAL